MATLLATPILGGFTTIGTAISTVATIGSVVLGVAGATRAAEAETSAATFNAEQATRDAELTRENVEVRKQQTEADITQADRDRRLRIGANIAAGGARGLGQPLDILRDNAAQEELNILTIQQQGLLTERAGEIQARGFETQADLEKGKARTATTQGRLGVGAKLLSGTSSIIRQQSVLG